MTANDTTICGKIISTDNSNVGHNWKRIDANDLPASVREEIECEILDGNVEATARFVASNGVAYRW